MKHLQRPWRRVPFLILLLLIVMVFFEMRCDAFILRVLSFRTHQISRDQETWMRNTRQNVQSTQYNGDKQDSFREPWKNPFERCRNSTAAFELTYKVNMSPRLWGAALSICVTTGDHEIAEKMLRRISSPNARHYAAYIMALLVDPSKTSTAIEFLECATGRNEEKDKEYTTKKSWDYVEPVPFELTTMRGVIGAFQHNHSAVMHLLYKMKQGDFGRAARYPDEACYNLVINSCTTAEEAKDIFQEMRLTRRHRVGVAAPTAQTITRALVVCRRVRNIDVAKYFIKQASMDGIRPDVYMYSAAISVAAIVGDYQVARYFWHDMLNKKVKPNIVTYNGMFAVYAASNQVEAAMQLFQHMTIPPSRTTINYLVKSLYCISDNVMKLVYLHSILDSLPASQWTVALAGPILEVALNTYGALGMYADARSIYDSIQGPADAACLRAILFACSTAQPKPEWEEALSLLHTSDIVSGARAPMYVDALSVSHAMLACSKADEWEESLQLLRLYGSDNTSILAMNSLIGACGRAKRPDMALEILNEMEDTFGMTPDGYSYRNAIIACNQAEHEAQRQILLTKQASADTKSLNWWECAVSLLYRMQEQGLEPDVQSYSSAISACEAGGQWQEALGILQSVLDKASTDSRLLNIYCFNAAISACEKGGAWVEALEIYEQMKGFGGRHLQPTAVTLGSLVMALDKAGQKELAQSVYEEGVSTGTLRPWRTTADTEGKRIRALDLHSFNSAMARSSLRSHLEWLLNTGKQGVNDDLMIIVGKGKHSQETPVLRGTVCRFLKLEYGIEPVVNDNNPGRISIPSKSLNDFITKRSWR
jgi:pentatricopeptide repeat domain-containing protein 1